MARRRRGRNWRIALFALAGIAGAGAVVAAYWVDWNPLPALGVMAIAGLLVYMPRPVYEAAVSFITAQEPIEPIDLALKYFGAHDPFIGGVFRGQWHRKDAAGNYVYGEIIEEIAVGKGKNQTTEQRIVHKATLELLRINEIIRPMFIDVDGSARRPDFHQTYNPLFLPEWLRAVLLPDLCGLNVAGVRRWRLYHVEQQGHYNIGTKLWFLPMSTAPELSRWLKAYPQVKALFGQDAEFHYHAPGGVLEVRFVAEGMGGKFGHWVADSELKTDDDAEEVPADMLPYEPLPFVAKQNPEGQLHDGWLYFGEQFLDRKAGGHWLRIDELTHFLVMGTSGFGKSVFLNQMLQGVRHNLSRFDQVLLVDLKGGVELWPYQALGSQFRVVYRLEDLPDLVAQLVATIEDRLERMRTMGVRMWPGAKTLLVVDEYAQIQLAPETTKEEKQRKQALLSDLNKISMLGRAAGVLIWAQLQKGTTDVMDSSFRANLASQVCFKVPNKLTAAGMFGSTDELMVDPVKLQKGRFILFDASKGETYYLQARVTG